MTKSNTEANRNTTDGEYYTQPKYWYKLLFSVSLSGVIIYITFLNPDRIGYILISTMYVLFVVFTLLAANHYNQTNP